MARSRKQNAGIDTRKRERRGSISKAELRSLNLATKKIHATERVKVATPEDMKIDPPAVKLPEKTQHPITPTDNAVTFDLHDLNTSDFYYDQASNHTFESLGFLPIPSDWSLLEEIDDHDTLHKVATESDLLESPDIAEKIEGNSKPSTLAQNSMFNVNTRSKRGSTIKKSEETAHRQVEQKIQQDFLKTFTEVQGKRKLEMPPPLPVPILK